MSRAGDEIESAPDGPLCVYFHGSPGSPAECARFSGAARAHGVRLVGLDRARIAPGLTGDAYFAALAAEVDALAAGGPVRLIGFSLGAFIALQVAGRLRAAVSGLDLVSPAGPLDADDLLDNMAGGPVFRLAMRWPWLFRMATRTQGAVVKVAPNAVLNALFAKSVGAEAVLARDPAFRAEIIGLLTRAYGPERNGYLRDLLAYVTPWASILRDAAAPIRIWQGSADTWTPPAMAAALAERLPATPPVTLMPGLGHYSTLFEAAPKILEDAGRAWAGPVPDDGAKTRMAIRLDPATQADWPEVVALTNRAYRAPEGQTAWKVETIVGGQRIDAALLEEDLAQPGATLLIARDAEGQVVGHVRLDESADGGCYLSMLTVRPGRQDGGLGRRLLEAAEGWARDRGARRMRMSVVAQRSELVAWYGRRGYAPSGERRPFPYGDARFGAPTRDDLYFVVLDKALSEA
ncbi:MAG: GNAT family N-acetyltransferase [Phenylobacterium sp.]|nr:GNAT family N-acetyltransferase [Phenylobacterium sp.]